MLEKNRTASYSILMPRPVPEMMEGKGEFYVRCMNTASMQSEFPDSQQRGMACVRIYKNRDKKRAAIGMGGGTRPQVPGVNPPPPATTNNSGTIPFNSVTRNSFTNNSVPGSAIAASDGGNMSGRRRRIKAAHIHTISLVPRGANQLPVIYKAEGDADNQRHISTIIKDDLTEMGELVAVVYSPEKRDSQGDIADAKTIKKMCHDFGKRGLGAVDLVHDGKPLERDRASIVESFIIEKGSPRFSGMKDYSGNAVDVTDGWAVVIKIEDLALRQQYREGKWNGVSMAGTADLEIEKHSEDGLLMRLLKKLGFADNDDTDTPDNGDLDMTSEELKKMLDENNKTILAQVGQLIKVGSHSVEVLKAAGVKDGDSAETIELRVQLHKATSGQSGPGGTAAGTPAKDTTAKPVFKGDLAKATEAEIDAFDIEVKTWEILKDIDKSDVVAVRKAQKDIAALQTGEVTEGDDDAAVGIEKDDTAKERTLKLALHKSRQRSNQSGDSSDAPGRKPGTNISKADVRSRKDGLLIAAHARNATVEEIAKIEAM